ncbi:phosphonate transport system substrate-binding protein [Gammaproteobacteria bacterium]
MHKSKIFKRFLFFIGFSLMLSVSAVPAEIMFGVMANRGELLATTEWTEFSHYLAEKIGQPVRLMTFPIDRTFDIVKAKGVDFVLTNPAQTAGLEEKFGARPLASWRKDGEENFGGVIVVNPQSGITHAADLKGKRVAAYSPESAGGYVFQRYHLLQAGVDVTKDLAELRFTKKQDDILLLVKAGLMDAGFVRTGVLESMAAVGKLAMSDVVVLDKVEDSGSAKARTTPLYPDWFVSAAAGTDAALVAKVKTALLALPANSPAAKAAKIDGFVAPLPRDKLIVMLKALKLNPFDK